MSAAKPEETGELAAGLDDKSPLPEIKGTSNVATGHQPPEIKESPEKAGLGRDPSNPSDSETEKGAGTLPPVQLHYASSDIGEAAGFVPKVIQRFGRPTSTAAAAVRALFDKSPLVAILSRHGAMEIACHAALHDDDSTLKVWMARPNSSVARGEWQFIHRHLAGLAPDMPRVCWVEARTERDGLPDLLSRLLAKGALDELRQHLASHSARLVIVLNHQQRYNVLHRYPELAEAGKDWLFVASWRDELIESWSHSAKGRELEAQGRQLSAFRAQLADCESDLYDFDQWSAMHAFHRDSMATSCSSWQSAEHFKAALASMRSQQPADQWLARIQDILATPPGTKRLQKALVALAAMLASGDDDEILTYRMLRTFGRVAIEGVLLDEESVRSVRENSVDGAVGLRVCKLAPGKVRAEDVWRERLDHLLQEAGLKIRTVDAELRVQFPDAERHAATCKLLFENYSSVVLELLDRLLDRNILFHVDSEVRAHSARCLFALRDLDRNRFMKLGERALCQADRLMRFGPALDDINHEIDPSVFRDRQHSLCVREFYTRYVCAGAPMEHMVNALVPQTLWESGVDELDRVLLRTQVCVDMPDFPGHARLGRRIDRATSDYFVPLRSALSDVRAVKAEIQAVRLGAVGAWLMDRKDRALPSARSFLLAEQVWIGVLLQDLQALGTQYDPLRKEKTLGSLFVENHERTRKLWPALLRVQWAQVDVPWFDLEECLTRMRDLLLTTVVGTAAEDAVREHYTLLRSLAQEALARVNIERVPLLSPHLAGMDLEAAMRQLKIMAKAAREVSDGDPKTLNFFMRIILRDTVKEESEMQHVIQYIVARCEYQLQPLRLLTGLLVVHWCFHRTGIQIDAAFREGEEVASQRELLSALLNTLHNSLRGQQAKFGAETLVWQWEQLVRVLKVLIDKVRRAAPIDTDARTSITELLEHKKTYLETLGASLKQRLETPAGVAP